MASEWRATDLGDFVRLQRGHDLTAEDRLDGPYPVMGSAGQNGTHAAWKANGPGVIVGRSGSSIGKVHYTESNYWPHNTCLYVTDFLGNDPRFTFYLLGSLDLGRYNSGSAQPSLNRNYIYGKSILVPPLEIQRCIARFLGAIDDRIDNLRQTNTTLEAIAQALFKSWFVDFDPVRARAEGREPEGMGDDIAALFPLEFEDSQLGAVPRGWLVTNVGSVAELIKGCSYKGAGLSDSDGAFMFNLGCFNARRAIATDNIKRYTGAYRDKQAVREGDLIMANTDMTQHREILGRTLFVPSGCEPGFISHHVFKVSITRSNVVEWRQYLFFVFQQSAFRDRAVGHATGTTVLALARDSAERCPLVEPSEQVLAAFSAVVSPLLGRIATNLNHARNLEVLRDTLLPRLISGKLCLPEAERKVEAALA